MINRDWPSFFEELLRHKDIDIIQGRLKDEAPEMADPMKQALLPLMFMRREQLLPESRLAPGSSDFFEPLAAAMHAWLRVVCANLESPTRLLSLGEYLTTEMEYSNLPAPGETIDASYRAFFENMLESDCEENVKIIEKLGVHFVLSLPYRTSQTLMKVANVKDAELQFLFIQEALDAPPYRPELKLVGASKAAPEL
jgi:hypothetical protein